jgi:single-stranded-DNA-specific exonuclease
MLACALAGNTAAMLAEYADLAAVGTIADVMPLTGTNAHHCCAGWTSCSAPSAGLAALMQQSGLSERKNMPSAVGFTLAPRSNAAGRLGCAQRAADLLMADQADAAASLAAELCALNRNGRT